MCYTMHMNEIDYEDLMNSIMDIKPTKYIVAGNYNEYQAYVKRKTRDQVYYKYVSGVDTIRGISEINGAYIGTFSNRPDINDIMDAIAVIKAKQEIKPAKYEWKGNTAGVGFVAQEVSESFYTAMNGGDVEQYIKDRVNSWVGDEIVYNKKWDSIIKDQDSK